MSYMKVPYCARADAVVGLVYPVWLSSVVSWVCPVAAFEVAELVMLSVDVVPGELVLPIVDVGSDDLGVLSLVDVEADDLVVGGVAQPILHIISKCIFLAAFLLSVQFQLSSSSSSLSTSSFPLGILFVLPVSNSHDRSIDVPSGPSCLSWPLVSPWMVGRTPYWVRYRF